jgi:hypothetical protein
MMAVRTAPMKRKTSPISLVMNRKMCERIQPMPLKRGISSRTKTTAPTTRAARPPTTVSAVPIFTDLRPL